MNSRQIDDLTITLDGRREQKWFCGLIDTDYQELVEAGEQLSRIEFEQFWSKNIGLSEVQIDFEYHYVPGEHATGWPDDTDMFGWQYKDRNGDWQSFRDAPRWLEEEAIDYLKGN